MEKISGFFQVNTTTATRCRSVLVGTMILTVLLGFTACKKSNPPTAQTPPPVADTNPATTSMPQAPVSTPPPVEVPANPDGSVDLKALNHAYINWIVQTRQAPKSFEDYVSKSGVKVPLPPPGKKYVIDHNGFINLANK
jgi:hypothetical protein